MRRFGLLCAVATLAVAPFVGANWAAAQGIIGAGPRATAPATGVVARMPVANQASVERALSAPAVQPGGLVGATASSADGSVPADANSNGIGPQAYGTEKYPYTTKRVAVWAFGSPNNGAATPVTSYPYRATGKLWAKFGANWSVCTASLIRKGVLVTAAHCIHNFGTGPTGFAAQVQWWPAHYPSTVPYGVWFGRYWVAPATYVNGTDTCDPGSPGVVCNNDLALVVLHQNSGQWPGDVVGIYGYAWNGYSFTNNPFWGNRYAGQVAQLGYPQAIDDGAAQIRTDSASSYFQATGNNGQLLKQQTIGSSQTGGSSGGPWLVNFGATPAYGAGSSAGTADAQAVVGVTSWGFTDVGPKRQGASWFGQNFEFPAAAYGIYGGGNIGALVQFICTHATVGPAC